MDELDRAMVGAGGAAGTCTWAPNSHTVPMTRSPTIRRDTITVRMGVFRG